MPPKTFCLIKTCALISNSLFYNDELNCDMFAGSQRSMSVKHGFLWDKFYAHVRGNIKYILTEMGYLHAKKYFAWLKPAL